MLQAAKDKKITHEQEINRYRGMLNRLLEQNKIDKATREEQRKKDENERKA
jgi:hypothetical protein